jgi:hypothetical protein
MKGLESVRDPVQGFGDGFAVRRTWWPLQG